MVSYSAVRHTRISRLSTSMAPEDPEEEAPDAAFISNKIALPDYMRTKEVCIAIRKAGSYASH